MTGPADTVSPPTCRVLGVAFFTGTLVQAADRALAGGLVVAPSAPGLAGDLVTSPVYRAALTTADLAIADSGWMVLLWRALGGASLPRHSGLRLMQTVLERPEFRQPGNVFWIMPTAADAARNLAWLQGQGHALTESDLYIAPRYGPGEIDDPVLITRLRERQPAIVMIAIGGGVQERLGLALRSALPHRPAILCLGAAIAFLTGAQTAIPAWADRLYLGWLIRLLRSPRSFWPRCAVALRLPAVMLRHRDRAPS